MPTSEDPPARRRPSGRRSGDSGTRAAILDSARDLFAEHGYDGASVRAIALRAGVDPALVRHFFGDKATLFTAMVSDRMTITQQLTGALDGDLATVGARAADAYLRLWDDPDTRPVLLALFRSASTSSRAADMLLEAITSHLRSGSAGPPDPEHLRGVTLAASHLLGVAFTRYIVKVPPIASLSHDELVARVAPAIQHYLSGASGPTPEDDVRPPGLTASEDGEPRTGP